MVAGLQLVYELASLRPIITSNRAAGVPLALSHAILLGAVDGCLWLLLLPAIFAAFDRTPIRRGQIGRHAVARTAVAVAAMAVQAAALVGILIAAGGFSDLGLFVRTSPLLNFGYEFETNVTNMLMIALAYAVLLRVHAVRHEHRVASALQLSLAAGMRALVAAILRVGDAGNPVARRRAIEAVAGSGERDYDDDALDADLAEPPEHAVPKIAAFGSQLQVEAREWYLAEAIRIALADGPLTAAERAATGHLAIALGMTQAQAIGVIALTEQNAGQN